MTKSILAFVLVAATVVLLSVAAVASPSFFGPSGGIFTPDDKVVGADTVSLNFNQVDFEHKTTLIGGTIGLTPDFELGISRFDSGKDGLNGKAMFNGKYVLLAEKAETPSVTFGVVDATGEVSKNGDASAYLVVGKNLTPAFTNFTGQPVAPIHGYIGIGTGMYRGPFLGLDWAFSEKASLLVEYMNKLQLKDTYDADNVVNASLRFKLLDELHADISSIDMKHLGYGLSYTRALK